MPKWFAAGSCPSLPLRRSGRERLAARIETLEGRRLLSNTWFVAPSGNDTATGTIDSPFRTIERAATLANAGDTVQIRAGVYRETVRPAHGGVTFQAYNGENVVVSGADEVGGWSNYSGDIYKASMPQDLGEGNNQLFLDGKLINEARWPNTWADLSHPVKETAPAINSGWGSATIYDPKLSGDWSGAGIHIMSGEGWYGQTGAVAASGNGWLTFSFRADNSYLIPRGGNSYYLYGKFQGLDSPGEWFRDNTGALYLWAPAGDSPAAHVVEVKARKFAFDLSGLPNVTLEGINLFAATVKTDAGSTGFVMDHVNANYISQFTWQDVGWNQPWDSGIELNGAASTVENSVIGFSSGDGVYINADNCRVTQTVIHDVAYNAGDSAAVRDFGNGATIADNLIYNCGRCGIVDRGWGSRIIGNTIHDVMLQTSDGGAIYTIRQNGWGSEIAYNTVFNVWATTPTQHRDWFAGVGIFLDDNSSNFHVHDNTVWNSDIALKMNYSSRGDYVASNQLAGWVGSIVGSWNGDWSGTTIAGNALYNPTAATGWGDAVYGNASMGGTPQPHPAPAPAPPGDPPSYLSLLSVPGPSGAEVLSAGARQARHPRHGNHAPGVVKLTALPPQTRRTYLRSRPATVVVRARNAGNAPDDNPLTITLLAGPTRTWNTSLPRLGTLSIADPRIRGGSTRGFRLQIKNFADILPDGAAGPDYMIAVVTEGTSYDPAQVPPTDHVAASIGRFTVIASSRRASSASPRPAHSG